MHRESIGSHLGVIVAVRLGDAEEVPVVQAYRPHRLFAGHVEVFIGEIVLEYIGWAPDITVTFAYICTGALSVRLAHAPCKPNLLTIIPPEGGSIVDEAYESACIAT